MKIKNQKLNKPAKELDPESKKYQDQVSEPIPEVIEVTKKVKAKESQNEKIGKVEKQLELQKIKQRIKNNVRTW